MIVTAKSHPYVFAAILAVDYDNGAVNRLAPERKSCEVPAPFDALLEESDKWLSTLTPEEIDEFCTLERFEVEEGFLHNPGFRVADRLLNAYFEEFCDGVASNA